jgi:hypothetical protein
MACSKCAGKSSGGFCVWCGDGSDLLARPKAQGGGLLGWISGASQALREASRAQEHGKTNAVLVCSHCQATGSVRTKPVNRKTGISGGKIAAAVLLSPLTLLATGISRNEHATQAHCDRCGSTWTF